MKGFPKAVKSALQKARDSALLAVEVYNKPAVAFKSGAYITLMIIAWTALFHAIFFRRGVKPYYRRDENKPKSRYVKVDGDYKHWELRECLKRYYKQDTGNPVRKNLEFFIALRNKIEHRSMPEIDPNIFGECQAMLLNFDEMLEKEFGARYCLRQSLSFALQMFPSAKNLAEAIKRNRNAQEVVQFVEQYRSTLSAEVLQSGQFSFKAFLIQVANHETKDALPIQFIHWDQLTEEQKQQLQAFPVMVKHKHVPVANLNTLSPSQVVKRVRDGLAKLGKSHEKLNLTWHTRCWQHYRVRPSKDSMNPAQTNTKYCIYDARHKDYGYTEEWVKFLIEEFKDDSKYEAIFAKRRGEHQ
jgi:hypothetical protein